MTLRVSQYRRTTILFSLSFHLFFLLFLSFLYFFPLLSFLFLSSLFLILFPFRTNNVGGRTFLNLSFFLSLFLFVSFLILSLSFLYLSSFLTLPHSTTEEDASPSSIEAAFPRTGQLNENRLARCLIH